MEQARVRRGTRTDAAAIRALYATVAATPGGLARVPDEITNAYVEEVVERSVADGVIVVAELDGLAGLAGELHTYRAGLRVFAHVLGELTVAVHPTAQGRGIGRRLFEMLLQVVRLEQPDITRIELITQESNQRALRLYESLGFRREGRLEGRIRSPSGGVEADIPMSWRKSVDTL